jgi:putative hydrolase of the HAD superfamily
MSGIDYLKPQIRNIIFDLGGVLLNIDYHAPVKALMDLGAADISSHFTKLNQDPFFDQLDRGKIDESEFYEKLRAMVQLDLSDKDLLNAWNAILLDMPAKRLELVHSLKHKFRTFILSNTNALHVREFEKIIDRSHGIEKYQTAFEKIYYSNEIHMRKPDPEIFRKVCSWNELNPKETLFIDDSAQHVKGAENAGLHAYHLDLQSEDINSLLQDWV